MRNTRVSVSKEAGGLQGNREPIVIGGSLKWNKQHNGDLARLHVKESFDGHIDEVALFGQALTQDQVRQVMQRGPMGVYVEIGSNGLVSMDSGLEATTAGTTVSNGNGWLVDFLIEAIRKHRNPSDPNEKIEVVIAGDD